MSTPLSIRDTFLARQGPGSPMYALFDRIPGVSFFAKDRQFRFMAANRHFMERFGLADETELVGKTDFDLFPARLAEAFRRDDEAIFASGEPKWHIVELFFNQQGLPDWFVTDKMPILDRRGKVMGVMGIVRHYGTAPEDVPAQQQIARAVEHIRKNFRQRITVETLAGMTHVSTRQLHRKFMETFGLGPQAMIMKLRVQAACELLSHPDIPINDIARDVGFGDQSSFTQHFHRHMGVTPLKYRRQFG